jgi:hypothetical protein
MNAQESEHLWRLVRTLQRQPEAVDDAEAQRALTVLLASRRDAAYLLLQRALVLELALARVQAAQAAQAASAPDPATPATDTAAAAHGGVASPAGRTPARTRPSPFLRDAATIAAGVVAGGLVLGALDTLGDAVSGEAGFDLDLDLF